VRRTQKKRSDLVGDASQRTRTMFRGHEQTKEPTRGNNLTRASGCSITWRKRSWRFDFSQRCSRKMRDTRANTQEGDLLSRHSTSWSTMGSHDASLSLWAQASAVTERHCSSAGLEADCFSSSANRVPSCRSDGECVWTEKAHSPACSSRRISDRQARIKSLSRSKSDKGPSAAMMRA
jgi:hypothetical protein